MRKISWQAACAGCLLFWGCIAIDAATGSANEAVRIERLAALCKLWGTVKFFHPQLAYQDIDWDGALMRAIPKVSAAASAEDYRATVDSMLVVLKDPTTRMLPPGEAASARPERSTATVRTQPYIDWMDDRTALIVMRDYSQFRGAQSQAELFINIFTEARAARAVILDMREQSSARPHPINGYWLGSLFSQALPRLLSEGFATSSIRYRLHSGFAPQRGSSSGRYFSALVNRDGTYIAAGNPESGKKPIVVLLGAGATDLHPILGGLQSAGLATVIYQGAQIESGGVSTSIELAAGVTAKVRVGEIVNPDGSLGLQPDLILPAQSGSAEPDRGMVLALQAIRGSAGSYKARQPAPQGSAPRPENFYSDTPYPSREQRLLALFRLWNTIEYFFAYKDLMDKPWNDVLTEFIPRMEMARDATEYHLAMAEAVKNLQDSHAAMSSAVLLKYVGDAGLPLQLKLIENRTAVVRTLSEAMQESPALRVGDAVLSVDGEAIAQRRSRIGRYFAASTPQSLDMTIDLLLLGGPRGSKAVLEMEHEDGSRYKATLTRSSFRYPAKEGPAYKVLDSGFGYFDLTRLTPPQLDAAFKTVGDAPALILDMRGYPNGILVALSQRLAHSKTTAAVFERREIHALDLPRNSRNRFEQTVVPEGEPYAGKVVMLINERAGSQAEHTCLFVEAATDVTFVGSPTSGVNGDVTTVGLPGGIFVSFSGNNVRHGDGRQLQRIGIQPHIKVEPTIEGIRDGRDEVLEKAVEFLDRSLSLRRTPSSRRPAE